ncbi:hypothetical protein AA21952_0793 [Acetobacter oeni LMG 21952]|nr:hypothetical protein AA21952_0793 [Acetobacter oeni LMG 21952]
MLTITWSLKNAELSSSAIGNSGFGKAIVRYGVIRRDVLRTRDARYQKFTQFAVNPDFLSCNDDKITIWQDLCDCSRKADGYGFTPAYPACGCIAATAGR